MSQLVFPDASSKRRQPPVASRCFTIASAKAHILFPTPSRNPIFSLLCAPPSRSSPPSPNPIYFLLQKLTFYSTARAVSVISDRMARSRSCAGAPAPSGVQSSSLATSRHRRPRPTSSSGSWSMPRSTPTPPAGLTPPSPWSPPPPPSSRLLARRGEQTSVVDGIF